MRSNVKLFESRIIVKAAAEGQSAAEISEKMGIEVANVEAFMPKVEKPKAEAKPKAAGISINSSSANMKNVVLKSAGSISHGVALRAMPSRPAS